MIETIIIAFWLICLYLAEKRHYKQFGEYLCNDKEYGFNYIALSPLYLVATFFVKDKHLQ